DVRILAATHQDLEALIRAGRFREDLYYRLNVISLRTPALRERKEDVFELAVSFLGVHAQRAHKAVTHLDDDAVEALVAYDWPRTRAGLRRPPTGGGPSGGRGR